MKEDIRVKALGMCTADALRFEIILLSTVNQLDYTAGDYALFCHYSSQQEQGRCNNMPHYKVYFIVFLSSITWPVTGSCENPG